MLVLVFLRVCVDSFLCLRFSVFVWALVLALAFRGVCMDFCACTCVSQCLIDSSPCFSFRVFVWTLVLVVTFISILMNSWAACTFTCAYSCVATENQP